MTARDILDLLAARHSKDLFVGECKDGPTQSVRHYLRLDAWVMKRSWSNPCSIGYEIKVSRPDFVRDEKMRSYIPLCHQFYVVAPSGIVDKSELPEGAGLICPTTNATRLLTKVKAVYRDIEWPVELLRYILMARVGKVGRSVEQYEGTDKSAFWRQWLETREINREFGWAVRGALREEINKRIIDVERKNEVLERENSSLAAIKKSAEAKGVNLHNPYTAERDLDKIAKEQESGFTLAFKDQVRAAMSSLRTILDRIEESK